MNRVVKIIVFLGLLLCFATAQTEEKTQVLEPKIARYDYSTIPKDPLASALFSATFPGMGEIYNKEYQRGVITGLGFWISFFLAQHYLNRVTEINTDTFYIMDTDSAYHQVTAPRPEDAWVGLPTREKIELVSSTAIMAGFYLWGIYDSYQGAKRYNKKLVTGAFRRIDLRLASSPGRRALGLEAVYRF